MGKRGPQPQSAELKALRGNPGKRAIPNTPKADPYCPPCPSELFEVMKDWNRYGEMGAKLGILRETDGIGYDAMFRTVDMYLKVDRAARAALMSPDPEIRRTADKLCALGIQYLGVLIKLLDRFGLNPASRSSIGIEAPPNENKTEFEKMRERMTKKA